MGTLYWQLNDCWPVTSWSSVDYFGNWKAFHFQAKRSYDAVLVSFEKVANGVEIHVVNDELQSKNGKLNLKVINFEGKELWSDSSNVQIAPNSSSVQFVLDISKIKKFNPRKNVLSASLVLSDKETKSSVYYFEKPKRLKLRKPSIAMIRLDENTYELTTDVLAKNVFLTADKVHFSDNYFDLLPGEKKFIKVNTPSESIKIQSLYNAFNE
jgi:beta-mannosidase